MGDILSKLQMVSEKIGVTETAHTIEEQVDLISESLDKIPHSTNIAEALDDLSEVAQNINNEEVYVDKTITANGEYLPAQDEATAYSKVTVNVPMTFSKMRVIADPRDNGTSASWVCLQKHDNGIYTYEYNEGGDNYVVLVALTPLKKCDVQYYGYTIIFTPSSDFDGFYDYNENIITYTGDTIVPGDGTAYIIKGSWNPMTGESTIVVTKTSTDFSYTIE